MKKDSYEIMEKLPFYVSPNEELSLKWTNHNANQQWFADNLGVTGTSVQKIAVVRHEKNKKCC